MKLIKDCFKKSPEGRAAIYQLCFEGQAAMTFIQQQNKELVAKYGHDVKFAGLTFLCINNWRFNSQTFESGLQPHHDAMMGWRYNGADGKCSVSLYGRAERQNIDLSKIAAYHGGGGHKHACGFNCDLWKLKEILDGVRRDA